jgi:hypothetical protein
MTVGLVVAASGLSAPSRCLKQSTCFQQPPLLLLLLLRWRRIVGAAAFMLAVVAALSADCRGGGVHVGCCYCVGGSLLGWPRSCWLLLLRRRIVCGSDDPVQLLKTINWSGVIVMKGEFLVMSYRLTLYDFSNDWHITRRECLFVVAAVAVVSAAAVVVAWCSREFRVVVVGRCWCCGGVDCGGLLRWRIVVAAASTVACYDGNDLLRWQWQCRCHWRGIGDSLLWQRSPCCCDCCCCDCCCCDFARGRLLLVVVAATMLLLRLRWRVVGAAACRGGLSRLSRWQR